MYKATYDPDADGVIASAQLDPAMTRDSEHGGFTPTGHHTAFVQADHDALPNPHHATTNDPTADQKAALPGTSGTPSGTNKYVTNVDPRNTDARTPTSHGHSENILHSLATAANDFLVASGIGIFVKKTLAETLTILGKAAASGLASLDASSKVVQEPASKAQASGIASLDTSSKVVQEPASKGAASGIAPLDAASKVPTANLGGAGASASNYLRGDQTWATPAGGGGMNLLKKTANQTINGGAGIFVDITNLTFPVVNGVDYAFYFYITFQSAATATGWKAGVNCPTGVLDFWAQSDIIANGPAGVATHTERHNTARDDMTLLTTTITAAVDLAVRIEGRYMCTANGTFAARFANELAANTNIVVQKGSFGYWF